LSTRPSQISDAFDDGDLSEVSVTPRWSATCPPTCDSLNRLKTDVDPESHSVAYASDADETLHSFTGARSLNTTREIDGSGVKLRLATPISRSPLA
jgi:hypothetical protein